MAEPAVNKDLVTKTNRTLVHQAARSDQPDIARYLVEQGCQLNARNADGLTPLAVAKQRGHEQTAAVLAELGATE